MKLASYRDGSRDGQLVVVSRDLRHAHFASAIATRLQQVLDDWNFLSPQLEDLCASLNDGKARHAFAFDARLAMAPLPRPVQRVGFQIGPALDDPQTRGAPVPVVYAGDASLGASEPLTLVRPGDSATCRAELIAVTGDLRAGATAATALDAVRLLGLANHWTLHRAEADGRGPPRVHPLACAFAPVLATPDELGSAWRGGRVHLSLTVRVDRWTPVQGATGAAMPWPVGEAIEALAALRRVGAGSVVGCAIGADSDPLSAGDHLRMELAGADGSPLFGSIEQRIVSAGDTTEADRQ